MPFHGISILLIQLASASCIPAIAVLLPLYLYPGDNCSAWSPVFSDITAHLSTTFYIIVNPNSGPGSGGSQPNSNFVKCVPQLRPSGSNTVLLGYVDTISPTSGSVDSDIDTYARWDSAYRPTGVFLDNVTPSEESVSTYQGYVSHATSMGFTFTALNPGEAASSSYYHMVDLVNTYEDAYSSFKPSSLSGTLSKQSVTLVNAPSTGSYNAIISQLDSLGVDALYITDAPTNSSDLPVQLSKFVDEIASVGGGSTPAPSESSTSPRNTASRSRSRSSSSNGSSPKSTQKGSPATSSAQISSSAKPHKQDTSPTHSGPPIATIVGGALGGLLFLALVLGAIFKYKRRSRRRPAALYPFTKEYETSWVRINNSGGRARVTAGNSATAAADPLPPSAELESHRGSLAPPSYSAGI